MVCGETGRFPVSVRICKRIITFWCKLLQSKEKKHKTFVSIYQMTQPLNKDANFNFPSVDKITQTRVGSRTNDTIRIILQEHSYIYMVWMCVKDFQTLTLCRPKFWPHFGPCTDKWQKIFENIYPKTPENQFLAAYICIFEKIS